MIHVVLCLINVWKGILLQEGKIVLEGMSGTTSFTACRKYDLKPARFYYWKDQLFNSAPEIFENRGRKLDEDRIREEKDKEIESLKATIAEIVQENLEIKKRVENFSGGTDMRSLFYDIHRTVARRVERSGYSISGILPMLGISRSWYYSQMSFSLILDGRFNPLAVRDDDEWIVIGFKRQHTGTSFREIAYTLIDEDIAHLSPSTVYRIMKKHDLITPWKHPLWESTRPEHAKFPDERWQTDIMYVKIQERFFYLLIFIDEYSRYIVHHSLLTAMDADSVSLEAQAAIEKLREDSVAAPVIQSDNGSSFIAMEFRIVLKQNNLLQKLIRPHTPEQNGIVERANKTMMESLASIILTDYDQARHEISRIVDDYNHRWRHSSLNYLTPIQYYMGNPEELIRIRESKIEKARILRRKRNMKKRKGGETAGTVS
jgi:putative transposase